jgi:hypothetical protein
MAGSVKAEYTRWHRLTACASSLLRSEPIVRSFVLSDQLQKSIALFRVRGRMGDLAQPLSQIAKSAA